MATCMQVTPRSSFVQPVEFLPRNEPVQKKAQPVHQLSKPAAVSKPSSVWEKESFSFRDFIDMINPLQHLPVISTIYRKLSGDEIGDAPRVVGGAIFGGFLGSLVTGVVSALANVFSSRTTGKDLGDHVMAMAKPAQPETAKVSHSDHAAMANPATPPAPEMATPEPVAMQQATPAERLAAGELQPAQAKMEAAIAHYRQHVITDEIKRDSDYWA